MKLTQDQIAKFCAPNDIRTYMAKPMRAGSWLYATNGHIAIRVPYDPEIDVGTTEGMKADIAALFDRCLLSAVNRAPMPELPAPVPCPACNGTGTAHVCGTCDGEGEFEHDGELYDCKTCAGTGQVWSGNTYAGDKTECDTCGGTGEKRYVPVEIGARKYQAHLLRLFANLGPSEVAVSDGGVLHIVGDGFVGLVMPMTR